MMGIEPMTSSLPRKCSTPELHQRKKRAGDETRTRDPNLGRVMLYQLSYSRIKKKELRLFVPTGVFKISANLKITRILIQKKVWGEEDSNLRSRRQQIYSLPHLAALESPRFFLNRF